MDQQLALAVSKQDLYRYGCPHCGGHNCSQFLKMGTCDVWVCEQCGKDCLTVAESISELDNIEFRNTDIRDLTRAHPAKTNFLVH